MKDYTIYVTEEIAKKVMEKGFPVIEQTSGRMQQNWYMMPTAEQICGWLRDEKNICIAPYRTACGYLYTIDKIPSGSTLYKSEYEGDNEDSGQYTTWEKALIEGINKALELI